MVEANYDSTLKMGEMDELKFFRCYICGQVKDVKFLKSVAFKDQIFKKDVCSDCVEKMLKTEGVKLWDEKDKK